MNCNIGNANDDDGDNGKDPAHGPKWTRNKIEISFKRLSFYSFKLG